YATTSCARANPSVAIIGPTVSVAPGATASFNMTLTNNDASGCGPSSFSLGASVPAGWTAAFGANPLNIAPGASASAPLQVTAPADAPNGTYSVGVSAYNSSAVAYVGSASVSETIYAPPPVSITVSAGAAAYTAGQKISFTATVVSGSAPVSGAAVIAKVV